MTGLRSQVVLVVFVEIISIRWKFSGVAHDCAFIKNRDQETGCKIANEVRGDYKVSRKWTKFDNCNERNGNRWELHSQIPMIKDGEMLNVHYVVEKLE